jgi:hypothetical protein
MKKTSRAYKQQTALQAILMLKPSVTVGEAARLLRAWEYRCGFMLNIKA